MRRLRTVGLTLLALWASLWVLSVLSWRMVLVTTVVVALFGVALRLGLSRSLGGAPPRRFGE